MAELTKTQIKIVQSISDGMTAEEIADMRFRSIGTIRKHLEQARERLGARNVAQLVKIAMQQGLIHSVVLAVAIGAAVNIDQSKRRVRQPRSFSVASSRYVRHEV